MLSIELINKDTHSIFKVLDSIKAQTFTDFEVVTIDSSNPHSVDYEAYGSNFRAHYEDMSMLAARFQAHQRSSGEYCLLLDGTRVLSQDCLERCISEIGDNDMLVIPEGSIGDTPLARLFRADRNALNSEKNRVRGADPLRGYVIPRFFRREVLDRAFATLIQSIPDWIFRRIVSGDHQLIFYEASKISNKIGLMNKELIFHIEDSNFSSMFGKYYRYGRSRKIFRELPSYRQLSNFHKAIRDTSDLDLKTAMATWALTILKGIPFALGYYL